MHAAGSWSVACCHATSARCRGRSQVSSFAAPNAAIFTATWNRSRCAPACLAPTRPATICRRTVSCSGLRAAGVWISGGQGAEERACQAAGLPWLLCQAQLQACPAAVSSDTSPAHSTPRPLLASPLVALLCSKGQAGEAGPAGRVVGQGGGGGSCGREQCDAEQPARCALGR